MKERDKKKSLEKILLNILGGEPYKIFSFALVILFFIKLPVNAFSFHFIHANVFHLIGNLLALSILGKSWFRIVLGYAVTSVLYLFTTNQIIGFSAIIYFVWGTYMWGVFNSTFKIKIKNFIVILFVMMASYFIPQISFYMHFAPFTAGLLISVAINLYRRINIDIKAALK